MDDSNYEDFKRYLSIQNAKVRNNITEIKSSELEIPYMLHIDVKPPSKFIPMMPRRAAESEDNTLPRITVADTLLGCIVAYCILGQDFYDLKVQGYHLCALDFDYCVKPTSRLVYDAEESNEHWLLGYNKKTLSYKPRVIGKLFVTEINSKREKVNGELKLVHEFTFCLELEEPIWFSEGIKLEKGFYQISDTKSGRKDLEHGGFTYRDGKLFDIETLSAAEYRKKKNLSVTMLSHNQPNVPLFSNW